VTCHGHRAPAIARSCSRLRQKLLRWHHVLLGIIELIERQCSCYSLLRRIAGLPLQRLRRCTPRSGRHNLWRMHRCMQVLAGGQLVRMRGTMQQLCFADVN
jgi:hypothetical protein